jgi:hypothetical protein
MPATITHSTIKNDNKEVVRYDIFVDTALVGTATKTDKGLFNFKCASGWTGPDLTDVKTMRDLKAEVVKNVPKEFVAANKPDPKPKAEAPKKAPKAGGKATKPATSEDDEVDESGEDIELS